MLSIALENQRQYGHLPIKQAETMPWENVKNGYKQQTYLHKDPANWWFEIVAIHNQLAGAAVDAYQNNHFSTMILHLSMVLKQYVWKSCN
jgi:hypothetical protein